MKGFELSTADNHQSLMQLSNGHVLNSWKEIARYMGLGVRTVQRYEVELGLPVRRPGGKERGSVMALSGEIDRWLQSSPMRMANPLSDCETSLSMLERILQHASTCPECNSRLHLGVGAHALRQSA